MLFTAFQQDGPSAVRYPRGIGPGAAIVQEMARFRSARAKCDASPPRPPGGASPCSPSATTVAPALAAAEALDLTVANMRFVKPIDAELARRLAATHDALVTVEENALDGGAGSACLEALAAAGIEHPVLRLGLPDQFVDHGDTALLLRECGLDADGVAAAVRRRFPELTREPRVKSVA